MSSMKTESKTMKKNIFKLFCVLGIAVSMAACSDDDDYTAGPESSGAFFPSGMNTTAVDIVPGDTERTFTIARSTSTGSETINLEVNDPAGLFHVPAVTFNDGQSMTEFTVTFDANALDLVDYTIQIAIPEAQAYMYGTPQLNFTLGIVDDLRWVTLDGKAQYTDDYIATLFGVSMETWELEIQKKVGSDGLYRLVNPYGSGPWYELGDYDSSRTYYLEVNANDPEGVYIPLCEIGLDLGYGPMALWSAAGRYLDNGNSLAAIKNAGYCGTLKDGVITFPVKALLTSMDGGLYYGNSNGGFKLVLPDSEK